MASSQNNDSSIAPEQLGIAIADVLQEQMLDETDDLPEAAGSNAREVFSEIDSLIFPPNNTDNSRVTTVDEPVTPSEPTVAAAATSVIEALDVLESGLSSVVNQDNFSVSTDIIEGVSDDRTATPSQRPPPLSRLPTQTSNPADENEQMPSSPGQHIMISYHHNSSYRICRQICHRLRELGYRVWMDTYDLHGPIHEAMAQAVENSYIVLFFINQHYYESEFCTKEALYTDKKHINFIPCHLQAAYEPRGWLGMITRDQLYIDFSESNNFDTAFEELVGEIQAMENRLPISPIRNGHFVLRDNIQNTEVMSTFPATTPVNNQTQTDALRTVIREFRESINQSNHNTPSMTEEEFSQFVTYIRGRVFPQNSSSSQTDNQISREVFVQLLQESQKSNRTSGKNY